MKIDTNFLCDLWIALSQFSRHENRKSHPEDWHV